MRRFALLAVMAVFATPAMAQESDEEKLAKMLAHPDFRVLNLDVGDEGHMTQVVKVSREETRNGVTTKGSAQYRYGLSFVYTDDSYRITKSLDEFKILDGAAMSNPDAQAVLNEISQGVFPLSYIADDSLTPVSIEDWDGVRARLYSLLETGVPGGAGTKARPEAAAALAAIFGQMTPESAAPVFLKEDLMMSRPHNIGLVLNDPLVETSQVAAPIGGTMLEAQQTLNLTKWDEDANSAHVIYSFAPTDESLRNFITVFLPGFLKQMGAPANVISEFEAELKTASASDVFKSVTECDYDVAIDSGLITKGVCTQIVKLGFAGQGSSKIERYEFSETLAE